MVFRIAVVAAFLVAGLAVTAGVSCACALYARPAYRDAKALRREELAWAALRLVDLESAYLVIESRGAGLVMLGCYEFPPSRGGLYEPAAADNLLARAEDVGGAIRQIVTTDWAEVSGKDIAQNLHDLMGPPNVARVSAGWPAPAFRGLLVRRHKFSRFPSCTEWRPLEPVERVYVLSVDRDIGDWTVKGELPYRPVWFGLTLDTVFYAAVIWTFVRFPVILRRSFRSQNGLCAICAYPIGVSPVCTECGTPLTQSARRRAVTRQAEPGR